MQKKWRRISFTLDATYDEDSTTEIDVNMSVEKNSDDNDDVKNDVKSDGDNPNKLRRKVSFKDEKKDGHSTMEAGCQSSNAPQSSLNKQKGRKKASNHEKGHEGKYVKSKR